MTWPLTHALPGDTKYTPAAMAGSNLATFDETSEFLGRGSDLNREYAGHARCPYPG